VVEGRGEECPVPRVSRLERVSRMGQVVVIAEEQPVAWLAKYLTRSHDRVIRAHN